MQHMVALRDLKEKALVHVAAFRTVQMLQKTLWQSTSIFVLAWYVISALASL